MHRTHLRFALAALAATSVLTSPPVSAREYGEAGTVEIGGALSIGNNRTNLDDSGTTTATAVVLAPSIGYFVADGLSLIGTVSISTSSADYEGGEDSSTGIGVGAGGGYFFPAGAARLGPVALLRYGSNSLSQQADGGGDLSLETSGTGFEVGMQVKVPVGGGGVFTGGLGMQFANVDAEVEFNGMTGSDSGTATAIGTSLGFTVFF